VSDPEFTGDELFVPLAGKSPLLQEEVFVEVQVKFTEPPHATELLLTDKFTEVTGAGGGGGGGKLETVIETGTLTGA
jgi:hypothetical protein